MSELKNNSLGNSQEEMVDVLRKELKMTRWCNMAVLVLLGMVLVGGIFLANRLLPVAEAVKEMQPAIEKIEQLDMETLNQKIEQLDIEGLNKITEELDAAELSETLKNINEAAAALKEVKENIEEFSDSVSNSFSGLFGKRNGNE